MKGRIIVIAGLTLREAVRSRFALSMLVLLCVVNLGLPLLIQGDGTAAGMADIMLRYTLGFSGALLSAATLWLACGSLSLDVQSRRIQHVLTKPVAVVELWLGKWLGIVLMNGLLLLVSYVAVWGLMQYRLSRFAARETDVLQPHMRFLPQPDDVREEVEMRYTRIVENRGIPEGVRPSHVRATLARRVRAERSVVGPGKTREWTLRVPDALDSTRLVVLQAKVLPPLGRLPQLEGEWSILPLTAPSEPVFAATHAPYVAPRLDVPGGVLSAGAAYTVRFKNLASGGAADSTLFAFDAPVLFLQPKGHFLNSYSAACLIQWLQLAALCAFGLLCGCCLSFPVASFVAMACVCVAIIGHSVTRSLESETGIYLDDQNRSGVNRLLNQVGEIMIDVTDVLVGPAFERNPLPLLAEGTRVRWSDVATAAWVLLAVYGGVSLTLSTIVLRRRELAMPMAE